MFDGMASENEIAIVLHDGIALAYPSGPAGPVGVGKGARGTDMIEHEIAIILHQGDILAIGGLQVIIAAERLVTG